MGTEDCLRFEWDEANIKHIALHRVHPHEADSVIRNDPIDLGYEEIDGEHRWTVIGHTDEMRILIVVFTMRGKRFRPVTSRDVSRRVRIDYLRAKVLDK